MCKVIVRRRYPIIEHPFVGLFTYTYLKNSNISMR